MKKYLFIFYFFLFNFTITECKVIDEVIAVVNNSVILKSEIDNLKKLVMINNSDKEENLNNNTNLYNMLLDQIIVDKMSYQIALDKKILIEDLEIDNFIEKLAIQNSMNKIDFLNKIVNYGINLNYYRDFIRRKITNNILYNKEIRNLINVSEKEIKNMNNNIDSNKILSLFTYYDFYRIKIPFNENSKENININNKSLINTISDMLKNNISIFEINKFINLYNKNIKIEKLKNKMLKNLDRYYISYFNNIDIGSVLGPILLNNEIHFIKINNINKPDFSKLINEVNISNILIKKDNKNINNLKEKIFYIFNNIKENKISFSEAAKKYSQDISSNNGGNIGWNIINSYDKNFIKEIKKLKCGEISKPFLSKEGWNILKLIETRNNKYDEFIKRQYSFEYLFNKKFYSILDEWIKNKKKSTYIKIYNN